MPRLIPQSNRLVSTVFLLVLFVLAPFINDDASAQRRRRPAQKATQQQDAPNTNSAASAGQTKSQKKNITPLRGGDTPDGSRLTITSDVPLNDYSAYRSGDRYYVEIPDANAPRAASGLRGRGFEDVQVQRRGDSAVISFKLQPGASARVSQKFNRLDVELSAPGGRNTASGNPTPSQTPAAATQATPRPTPQTPATTTPTPAPAGQANQTQPGITGANSTPGVVTPGAETIPPTTFTQPPDAAALPSVSPEVSPAATPPTDVVAQAQPQAETQPITQPATATPSSSFGATLARNWMLILIVGLVLASLVLIVAARSRARGTGAAAAAPARRVSRKERVSARAKASEKLSEASVAEDAATAAKSAIVLKPGTLPKAVKIAKDTEKPAVAAAAITAEETKEVEPVAAVDVERIELEVKNLLGGESYDEALIGSSDRETRQLVATELLSALAARNLERRERARTAFVKHEYLDEATRNLRTAGASAERASAARSLGFVADKATTPHLIAALEDEAPEVRRAAVEALAEMGDPSAAEPLQSLLKRERDKKVPLSLIERAISASTAVVEVEEAPASTSVEPVTQQEEVTLEAAPVIEEAETQPALERMGLVSEGEATAVVEEEEAVTLIREVEPSDSAIAVAGLAAAEAAEREREEEAERLRAEEDERERLVAEAEARRAAEEEEFRREAERLEQEERERIAREQAEREEQERLEAEARRKAEEEEAARLQAEEEARLKAEEETRLKAEEEERVRAEEEARLRAEEEARLAAEVEAERLRAEEEARLKAEEQERRLAEEAAAAEEARLRTEVEEQRRAEAERRHAEERARLAAAAEAQRQAHEEAKARQQAALEAQRAAEAEARRKAEEEAEAARLRAEEEEARLKAEEEARLKAEEEARVKAEAEAEARRRAEEEAEAQRKAEEEAERLRAEENARRLAAEEVAASLDAQAVSPVEHNLVQPVEASSQALPFEPVIERGGSEEGWVELDVTEPEVIEAEPAPAEAVVEAEVSPEPIVVEPTLESTRAIEPAAPAPVTKEIEYAVTEKGVDIFDENTTVPRAILRRLSSEEPDERASAVIDLARVGGDDSFREINAAFDDPAVEVRNAAARSLFNVHTDRAATFTRALREAPPERRRKIGAALASSGLASEAIGQLMGESREKTYDAFSLLFLMSKAGEVQPLMRAIEEHPNNEVRLAVIKLLALSGQQEILPAFRRLAVRGSLPTEVRSAVMEAIYQLSSQSPTAA